MVPFWITKQIGLQAKLSGLKSMKANIENDAPYDYQDPRQKKELSPVAQEHAQLVGIK
ncbi:hypothetical protein [Sporosarcina sp. P18a]|uniref:hypothetical protein n=1 Tax=Sporosarcina sp. P18a TaxID=2048259 RepID=UPI00130422C5|nr:hypothetical protein [Sporosarcina sp. P18a]